MQRLIIFIYLVRISCLSLLLIGTTFLTTTQDTKMTNELNFNNLQLAVELGGSFGMLALTIGALIYTIKA